MSGRAGRRGKDDQGLAIMMVDDKLDEATCRDIVAGRPSPLVSSFRLSYYTLLNIMRRLEGSGQVRVLGGWGGSCKICVLCCGGEVAAI